MGFSILDLQKNQDPIAARSKAREKDGRAEMKYIDIGDLLPSEENFYPMSAIDELADMIQLAGGVKQPALVVPLGGGKYKLLSGHRRRLASMTLVERGLEEYRKMPCVVEEMQVEEQETPEDGELLRNIDEQILLIATNCQRVKSDWVKVEEVTRLRELLQRKREFGKIQGKTRAIIAQKLGTTPAQVGRYESIAKHLSEPFREELKQEKIGISVAYELSTMELGQQEAMWNIYKGKGDLSIDEVRMYKEKHKERDIVTSVEPVLPTTYVEVRKPPEPPIQQEKPESMPLTVAGATKKTKEPQKSLLESLQKVKTRALRGECLTDGDIASIDEVILYIEANL